MGTKPTLVQLTTGNVDPTVLNSNMDILAEAVADAWDRQGTGISNNTILGDLDMNGYTIKNVGDPDEDASSLATRGWVEQNYGTAATTEAEHWANYPEDQLVPEGDLVDDYSAMHFAAKAADSAAAALISENNAETAETNAELAETNAEAAAAAAAQSAIDAAAAVVSVSAATTTTAGIVELATTTEIGAGIATTVPTVADLRTSFLVSGTPVASTSGTQVLFSGIPSWAKRIHVMLYNVSMSGTDELILRIGDSGGIETTGYLSVVGSMIEGAGAGSTKSTTSFQITRALGAATAVMQGMLTLCLLDPATNLWVCAGNIAHTTTANGAAFSISGSKALTTDLTQLAIDTTGTNTFDLGSINIMYE